MRAGGTNVRLSAETTRAGQDGARARLPAAGRADARRYVPSTRLAAQGRDPGRVDVATVVPRRGDSRLSYQAT